MSQQNMAWQMVLTYLHFKILKFPLSSRGPQRVTIALDLWNVSKGKTNHMDRQRLHVGVILLGSVQFCPVGIPIYYLDFLHILYNIMRLFFKAESTPTFSQTWFTKLKGCFLQQLPAFFGETTCLANRRPKHCLTTKVFVCFRRPKHCPTNQGNQVYSEVKIPFMSVMCASWINPLIGAVLPWPKSSGRIRMRAGPELKLPPSACKGRSIHPGRFLFKGYSWGLWCSSGPKFGGLQCPKLIWVTGHYTELIKMSCPMLPP